MRAAVSNAPTAPLPHPPPGLRWSARTPLRDACALLLGICLTLAVRGYQFGQSNHDVYLLDALRRLHPNLLSHDWFTTHTLQYHALFGLVTETLMRFDLAPIAFLIGYLLLAVALHIAWLALTRALGGSIRTYLLSVVLFYISAGGTGLGMYQFLQDAAFLPSNIAAVALLAALVCWISRRPLPSAACFAVAGAMHLNYAVVIPPLWVALLAWDRLNVSGKGSSAPPERQLRWRPLLLLSLLALFPCLLNIAFALRTVAAGGDGLSLHEFVDLYVRLRHPHHYNPRAWPAVLWLCFLWPIPFVCFAATRRTLCSHAWTQFKRIYLLLALLVTLALLLAGFWYVSQTLIQMSLYRFTPHLLLLGCVAAAILLQPYPRATTAGLCILAALIALVAGFAPIDLLSPFRISLLLIAGLIALVALARAAHPRPLTPWLAGIALIAVGFIWNSRHLGINIIPEDPPAYLTVCDWARDHTPEDAIFVVPPGEQSFRFHARRAIVVNFKGVPQLSANLPEWRDRLTRLLQLDSLMALPHPFAKTLAALNQRYETCPPAHLIDVARHYHARYLLVNHPLPPLPDPATAPRLVHADETGSYFLYDLAP